MKSKILITAMMLGAIGGAMAAPAPLYRSYDDPKMPMDGAKMATTGEMIKKGMMPRMASDTDIMMPKPIMYHMEDPKMPVDSMRAMDDHKMSSSSDMMKKHRMASGTDIITMPIKHDMEDPKMPMDGMKRKNNDDNKGKDDNQRRMIEMTCPMSGMPPMPRNASDTMMMASGTMPMPPMMMASDTMPDLKKGDGNRNGKGPMVMMLQDMLIKLGYLNASSTGNFGDMTRLAVVKYQKDMGITKPTGYFGPQTKEKIRAKCLMPMDDRDHMNGDRPMPASGTMPMMGR